MTEERLLKRIGYWLSPEDAERRRADIGAYTESVFADLANLYNTRRGSVQISGEYGLPDFVNMLNSFTPPAIESIENVIRETTQKFEPRLRDISVQHVPRDDDEGLLRFNVNGNLVFRDNTVPVQFDAVLQGDGSVALQV
ncbi:MAG TPA: type VI secretion system baseplate subunit TssE [Gammaproteobacteria bacterium]